MIIWGFYCIIIIITILNIILLSFFKKILYRLQFFIELPQWKWDVLPVLCYPSHFPFVVFIFAAIYIRITVKLFFLTIYYFKLPIFISFICNFFLLNGKIELTN